MWQQKRNVGNKLGFWEVKEVTRTKKSVILLLLIEETADTWQRSPHKIVTIFKLFGQHLKIV